MLRAVGLVAGIIALAGAAIAAVAGAPLLAVIWLASAGAALIVGIIFERGRYKPTRAAPPGPGWVDTGERFVDPTSGEAVTVYFQPDTGERCYVRR